MKILGYYRNGNYDVSIFSDGSKIRGNTIDGKDYMPNTVESINLKITNKCGGSDSYVGSGYTKSYANINCRYCCEGSSPFGKHCENLLGVEFLKKLHPYCVLNITGGNPLQHPELCEFLLMCKKNKVIVNMFINQRHFMSDYEFVKTLCNNRLIWKLNVSLTDAYDDDFINKVKELPNCFICVINGIVTIEQLEQLKHRDLKLCVLGYKQLKRGDKLYNVAKTFIDDRMSALMCKVNCMLTDNWFHKVEFDTLSKQQLRLSIIDNVFNDASVCIDLVESKFSVDFGCSNLFDILDNVEDMYKHLQNMCGGFNI